MKEALKLALEALERLALPKNADDIFRRAITAIKEALTQPEQEPAAWLDEYGNAFPLAAKQYSVVGKHWKPLYTTPPQRTWVGLRDEQIEAIAEEFGVGGWICDFARAIEAELKEKNDC